MKKILTFVAVSLLFVGGLIAQDTLFTADFENGTNGQFVAQEDTTGFWTTWNDAPGGSEDAVFSDAQNHTPGGSMSAHVQGTTTDLVLKLGNKVSGKYEVSFYYYIINGKGGYFNIQHSEEMGDEFAFECYFGNNGNGKLTADGSDLTFTHATDAWVYIDFIVDLEADSCWLAIDNDTIKSWIYSHQSNGAAGDKQLGGVDFYAGAISGQTPEYYLDDVSYICLEQGATPPQAEVNMTEITTSHPDGTIGLKLHNAGDLDMDFEVFPVYSAPTAKRVNSATSESHTVQVKLTPADFQTQETLVPVVLNTKDETLTKLTGDITHSLGFTGSPDVEAAVLFKNTEMEQYVGMELTSLIIIVGGLPQAGSASAKVWTGRKTTISGPIREELTQAFTPAGSYTQNQIDLTSPVYITGDDLFIGWEFTQPVDSFCVTMDAGPPTDDANWVHVGPSWSEITRTDFGNFGIIGNLTGNTAPKWINLTSNQGVLGADEIVTVNVTFDTTGLADDTIYRAKLVVRTNDLDEGDDYIEIPVTLKLGTAAGLQEHSKMAVMTYPNPAYDFLNVSSSETIKTIEIVALNGQVVTTANINAKEGRINISDLTQGVYVVRISTNNGISTSKLVIK